MNNQAPASSASNSLKAGDVNAKGSFSLADLFVALRNSDIALASGVIVILVVLIMPLPAALLDFLLAISIVFSVLVLMTALFIQGPLEFTSFPTVLLIATMIRLSLNLASTRLILANGHEGTDAAGNVIEAFGHFVMGGNFVIGIIVFSILIIVNFIVITKGSGRIAEVAARFTLDAMPGKQMAIDADLSAGLIEEDEARTRRRNLEDESSFFGAMDGASKFVRGDAIAGLLITFINVVAGIIIGVAQKGLSFSDAAHTYTLLTIGDGLVSQVPALIVSTAAGLMVSKAGVKGATDKALGKQLASYPKALGMSAAVMAVMAILPGMPVLPFLGLAAGAGILAYRVAENRRTEVYTKEVERKVAQEKEEEEVEAPISQSLQIDELRVELGYGLVSMINGEGSDLLTEQIKALRRQIAKELGMVMPSVRILDNVQLEANDYVIKIKEVEAGRGEVYPKHYMVMDPSGVDIDLPGIHTTEPTFSLPATWVSEDLREEASLKGMTVVDPATVLSTHLTELIKGNVAELLSYGDVQKLLSELPADQAKLVEEIVPGNISISGIQRVLQTLLSERISIRDLCTVLEGIAENIGLASNPVLLTERVRARLARQISAQNLAPGGYLPLVAMSPEWETAFLEAIVGEGENQHLAMAPSKLQEFVIAVKERFEDIALTGEVPVLLTSPHIRPFVRSIIERFRAHTVVMSQAEVHPSIKLKTLASI